MPVPISLFYLVPP